MKVAKACTVKVAGGVHGEGGEEACRVKVAGGVHGEGGEEACRVKVIKGGAGPFTHLSASRDYNLPCRARLRRHMRFQGRRSMREVRIEEEPEKCGQKKNQGSADRRRRTEVRIEEEPEKYMSF